MRLFPLVLLLLPTLALAARPMQTDDARIVDAKACQLESWVRVDTQAGQLWALPGCNPTGNLELTFGGAVTRPQGGDAVLTDRVFQAKTIFRTLQTNDWAWGLAAGINPHPNLPSPTKYPACRPHLRRNDARTRRQSQKTTLLQSA